MVVYVMNKCLLMGASSTPFMCARPNSSVMECQSHC